MKMEESALLVGGGGRRGRSGVSRLGRAGLGGWAANALTPHTLTTNCLKLPPSRRAHTGRAGRTPHSPRVGGQGGRPRHSKVHDQADGDAEQRLGYLGALVSGLVWGGRWAGGRLRASGQ